jgi:preprotein translocase SecE subunit
MKRSKKAVSLIYLACAAISWLILREMLATLWVIAKLPQPLDWMFPPSDIISAALAIILFVILVKSEKVDTFTNEVITELSEVVWPKKKETVLSTGIVSVLVGICAGILFGFDMVWGVMIRVFYK